MRNLELENLMKNWKELLESKKWKELRLQLLEANEVDVAEFIADMDPELTVLVFRMLPKEAACDVFVNLEPEDQ